MRIPFYLSIISVALLAVYIGVIAPRVEVLTTDENMYIKNYSKECPRLSDFDEYFEDVLPDKNINREEKSESCAEFNRLHKKSKKARLQKDKRTESIHIAFAGFTLLIATIWLARPLFLLFILTKASALNIITNIPHKKRRPFVWLLVGLALFLLGLSKSVWDETLSFGLFFGDAGLAVMILVWVGISIVFRQSLKLYTKFDDWLNGL